MSSKITSEHLARKAIIYVRQSTAAQVVSNRESQRRQYGLRDSAEALGFRQIEVIDEDLGRSASGSVDRPGFERLLGMVCAGHVGAIICIEASRLARNGRDWHLLIEFCALMKTLVVDPDGVYDPKESNDRLLLGIKGSVSEFELHLLRQRSREALVGKAERGELEIALPVGLCWVDGRVELDPDLRVQESIRLVFSKFAELRTARQVFLWFLDQGLELPTRNPAEAHPIVKWKAIAYHRIHAILTSPVYAGAYCYGRTETRTRIVEGRPRKTEGHAKSRERWRVLIQDHHPGYIDWDDYERNLRLLTENAHAKSDGDRKSGRGGKALLTGKLRCRRCGRLLRVRYSGTGGSQHRYLCLGDDHRSDRAYCLSIGGIGTDRAVGQQILEVVEPRAIEAAIMAEQRIKDEWEQLRRVRAQELEQAQYEAQRAAKRYESVDPENRLVAAELESRWNDALSHAEALERKAMPDDEELSPDGKEVSREGLMSLAGDVAGLWEDPTTDAALKQKIVAILIEEVVVDIDEKARQAVLLIHWVGGRHSELRLHRRRHGTARRTSLDAIDVVKKMAGRWPDKEIASTLNRLHLKTASRQHWTQVRVRALRHRVGLSGFEASSRSDATTNLSTAAARLGVSACVVRKLIQLNLLRAEQALPYGPWEIHVHDLETPAVRDAVGRIVARQPIGTSDDDDTTPLIPGLH